MSYFLSYDSDGNKVEKTSVNGQVKTITTGTDSDGESFVSNDGITAETVTDDFGRISEEKTLLGEGQPVFFTNYEYAGGNKENSTTNLVSKFTQQYGTDELVQYEYTYDKNGNITEIKQNGKTTNKYTYDSLNQLKDEYDYVNLFYIYYSYDNSGNIQAKHEQALHPTYLYPTGKDHGNVYYYNDTEWKDKLTRINGYDITYDETGNPLSYRDSMTMTWQNGRQLASLQTTDNSVTYKYDSNGMRTRKTDNSGTTYYYYDCNNSLIGLTKGNDTLLFYYDSDGNVTSLKYNGTMLYYVKNLLGDVVKIISQDGVGYVSYVYDSWGNVKSVSGEPTLRELNPFRYRSYVYDNESGLYYLQSRYCDPITGRFLNADVYCDTESGSPLSANMFAYCENNAVMRYDVTGKDAWWIQSPNSAYKQGHTSLLIQEKPGYWWYFYFGDKSIQLLFLGTTTLKDINKKVRNIINRYNREYGFSIPYEENYTKSIRFKGDFLGSLQYINRYMNAYSKAYGSKIFKLRVSSESNAVNKKLRDSAHMYYKNKLRPQSMIIRGNKTYDLLKWNCMQISSAALSYGSVKNVNKNYFKSNIAGMGTYIRPVRAYRALLDFRFGTEVCI